MARRRGLWNRLRDWWNGSPEPPSEPPPAPPPPEPPEAPDDDEFGDDEYRETWREITDTSPRGRHAHVGSYSKHIELFQFLPGMTETTRDERLELWELYLRVMVNGDAPRNDPNNGFWAAMGIHPRSAAFDWQQFRAALGYKRRK